MAVVLSRKSGGGGGSGSGVTSLAESGQPALTGAVTLSEGTGVTLTQVGQDIEVAAAGGGLFETYAQLSYTVASGTDGGTSTAGSWQTRPLNTEDFDPGGIVSLAADQFVLSAGTYFAVGSCFFENPNARSKLRIRNVTDGATALVGLTQWMPNAANGVLPTMQGRFTIAAGKTLEFQYFVQNGVGSDGLGVSYAATGEVEIYASLTLYREA